MKANALQRKGSALILSIVVLTVVMAVLGTMLKVQVLRQKQLLHREWQLQAQCLAESAHERAWQRLQLDPAYTGEDWQVTLPETSIHTGAAKITVQHGGTSDTFKIAVSARVPDHPQHRAQLTTTRTISLESK